MNPKKTRIKKFYATNLDLLLYSIAITIVYLYGKYPLSQLILK